MLMEVENVDSLRHGKVLADFYTSSCTPCKLMQPILEEVSDDYPEITFAKIDMDKNPQASQMFGIMSVPTIMFMQNSQVKEISRGLSSKSQIRSMIEKHMNE